MTDTEKQTYCEMVDKIDEIMKFPLVFPIKIMGLNRDDYVAEICNVIRKHYPTFDEKLNKVEYSKTKKYVSLTVTVTANSKPELDACYLDLTKHPFVKVVF